MNTILTLRGIIVGALLSVFVAVTGLGLAGTAEAENCGRDSWCHWCPADGPRQLPYGGVNWDMSVCHTYTHVRQGQGNVAPYIWDGPDPPRNPGCYGLPCGLFP